mgnify:CR=1 FL=1
MGLFSLSFLIKKKEKEERRKKKKEIIRKEKRSEKSSERTKIGKMTSGNVKSEPIFSENPCKKRRFLNYFYIIKNGFFTFSPIFREGHGEAVMAG